MADDDRGAELFEVRNALAIGAWQQCINEAQKLEPSSDDAREECNTMMYRAMIAQGKYATVKSEITADDSSSLQAVKRLAQYLHRKSDRAGVLADVKKLQDDGISMGNPTTALTSGIIYMHEGQFEDALRCLKNKDAESPDTLAMAIQALLQINRVDVASKELSKMKDIDDDSTITKLAESWVQMGKGGDNLNEAFFNYDELVQKYGDTPLLLNGQAAASMAQGKFEEAEGFLLTAQEKDANDAETLINLNVVSGYLKKAPEVAMRYLNQLKDSHPDHPFTVALMAKENEFDELCEKLSTVGA